MKLIPKRTHNDLIPAPGRYHGEHKAHEVTVKALHVSGFMFFEG